LLIWQYTEVMDLKAHNIQIMSAVTERTPAVMISASLQNGADPALHPVTIRITKHLSRDPWTEPAVSMDLIQLLSQVPDTWVTAAAFAEEPLAKKICQAVLPQALKHIRKDIYENGILGKLKKRLEKTDEHVTWFLNRSLEQMLEDPPSGKSWHLVGLLDYRETRDSIGIGLSENQPLEGEARLHIHPSPSHSEILLSNIQSETKLYFQAQKQRIEQRELERVMGTGLSLREYRASAATALGRRVTSRLNTPHAREVLYACLRETPQSVAFVRTKEGDYRVNPFKPSEKRMPLSQFKKYLEAMDLTPSHTAGQEETYCRDL
jgi:hypothetical protein